MSKVEKIYGVPKAKNKDSEMAWYSYSDSPDSNPFNGKSIAFAYELGAAKPFVKAVIYFGILPASGGNDSPKTKSTSSESVVVPTKQNAAFTGRTTKGQYGVVKLYASPNPDAAVVGTVKDNQNFPCYYQENGYFFFSNGTIKGWLNKANVKVMRAD